MSREIPEYTSERAKQLAERVVDSMDLKDMIDYIKEDLEHLYKGSGESFEADWDLHPPPAKEDVPHA
jgi:hypothetical protein